MSAWIRESEELKIIKKKRLRRWVNENEYENHISSEKIAIAIDMPRSSIPVDSSSNIARFRIQFDPSAISRPCLDLFWFLLISSICSNVWFLEWFLNWNVRLIDTSLKFALKFATNWAIRLFLRNRKCALDPKFGFGNQFAKAVWLFGVHVWNTLCALLFSRNRNARVSFDTVDTAERSK